MQYTLTKSDLESFAQALQKTGELTFGEDGLPAPETLEVLDQLKQDGALSDLLSFLKSAIGSDSPAGYAVVRGIPLDDLFKTTPQYLTTLSALVGLPFQMGTRFPAWQELGVNFNTADHKFGGTGYQPSHIDGVNVDIPPDFLVLACGRADPLGGGKSTLSYLQDLPAGLEDADLDLLSQEIFTEGQFFDLAHVGGEKKPFRVLEKTDFGLTRVRFSGKVLYEENGAGEHQSLIARTLNVLDKNMIEILLEPGDALIVNQMLLAHGRTALGDNQAGITADQRRYFRQGFIRDPGAWVGTKQVRAAGVSEAICSA